MYPPSNPECGSFTQPEARRDYWLEVEGGVDVDLYWRDPGYEVDPVVESDLGTLTGIWVGDYRFDEVLRRRELELRGSTGLRRSFPDWPGLSPFAGVERP